ncbi:unnamed protein product [Brachionus calyciflorus]|uniref:acylglycerol lipase n=1 Tax=Brachionus calyciflorus TaxID=104777 RepID=A0A813QEU3_9BILA|nr:unnamed protein product [Brachionus calyciflorus]
MICCETNIEIQPEGLFPQNFSQKSICVKNEKEINLVHLNENRIVYEEDLSAENLDLKAANIDISSEIISQQPKSKPHNFETDQLNDKIQIKKFPQSSKKNNFLSLNFSSIQSLVESNFFEKKIDKNINYLNGIDTFGLKITYKNYLSTKAKQEKKILPLLFFIHGVGGSSVTWKHQLKFFGDLGFEIIALDLIGHGKSTKSKDKNDYTFGEICTHVLKIFDIYAKNENVIIAHSYGCSFAVYLSQERYKLIKKLVLISGGLPFPLNAPLIFFKCIKPFVNCHFYCSAFGQNYQDNYLEAFKISAESLFYTMKGQYWHPIFKKDKYFKDQKVLLIEGENDKFVPYKDAFEMFKGLDNSYLIQIEEGSHMILLEESDVINKLILLFLKDP